MYGAPDATSVNLALSAHVELMKSCETPEPNNIMMECSLRKNVPARTSSPVGMSSTVVQLVRPDRCDGPLWWLLCWLAIGAGVRGELICLSRRHSLAKCPTFP
jgi:hypothetical protein